MTYSYTSTNQTQTSTIAPKLTPNLQAAIHLLSLSSTELELEIHQILDKNFVLEEGESESTNSTLTPENSTDSNIDFSENTPPPDNEELSNPVTIKTETHSIDIDWDSLYPENQNSFADMDTELPMPYQNYTQPSSSTKEDLLWQIALSNLNQKELEICHVIVEAINENGFLLIPLKEIQDSLSQPASIEEIERILKYIQNLDPPGIGARNVAEYLSIQIKYCDAKNFPFLRIAEKIIQNHLEELAKHNYQFLMRRYHLTQKQLSEILHFIHSLNPHTHFQSQNNKTQYITPDVFVYKKENRWVVELNTEILPHIRINKKYATLSKDIKSKSDIIFIRDHLQEARWFIKSLKNRNETLLRVTQCIMDYQKDFLEYGPQALKPLILSDIAEELQLNESTVSRVTTNKYVSLPQGTFELKYFFSGYLVTRNGQYCSTTAIQNAIKKLIQSEDCSKPLKDHQLVEILNQYGIKVARRTIAKYREQMGIAPAHQRKSLDAVKNA